MDNLPQKVLDLSGSSCYTTKAFRLMTEGSSCSSPNVSSSVKPFCVLSQVFWGCWQIVCLAVACLRACSATASLPLFVTGSVGVTSSPTGDYGFGSCVVLLPDVDGDGYGERLVGHSLRGGGFTGEGAIYFDLLTKGGAIKSRAATHSNAEGGMKNKLQLLAAFGESCSCVQSSLAGVDLDGDSTTFECFIGSPGDIDGTAGRIYEDYNYGAVWMLKLRKTTGAVVGTPVRFNKRTTALSSISWQNNLDFGASVAVIGGTAASLLVAVGCPGFDKRTSSSNNGEVIVLRVTSSGTSVSSMSRINYQDSSMPSALSSWLASDNVELGRALAPSGDFDGDGLSDVAFGVRGVDSSSRSNMGLVGILLLDASGGLRGASSIHFDEDVPSLAAGAGTASGLGSSLVVLGDVFGNGGSTIISGAPLATDLGAVVVLALDGSRSLPLAGAQFLTRSSSSSFSATLGADWRFGSALSVAVGDLDSGWTPLVPGSLTGNASAPTPLVITSGLNSVTGKLVTIDTFSPVPRLLAAATADGEAIVAPHATAGQTSESTELEQTTTICCFEAREGQSRSLVLRLDTGAVPIDTSIPPQVDLIVPPPTRAVSTVTGKPIPGVEAQGQAALWSGGRLVVEPGSSASCLQAVWLNWLDTRTSANLTCIPPPGTGAGFRAHVVWKIRNAPALLPASLRSRKTEMPTHISLVMEAPAASSLQLPPLEQRSFVPSESPWEFNVSGTGFGPGPAGQRVLVGGSPCRHTNWLSSTLLQCSSPPSVLMVGQSGNAEVRVEVGGRITDAPLQMPLAGAAVACAVPLDVPSGQVDGNDAAALPVDRPTRLRLFGKDFGLSGLLVRALIVSRQVQGLFIPRVGLVSQVWAECENVTAVSQSEAECDLPPLPADTVRLIVERHSGGLAEPSPSSLLPWPGTLPAACAAATPLQAGLVQLRYRQPVVLSAQGLGKAKMTTVGRPLSQFLPHAAPGPPDGSMAAEFGYLPPGSVNMTWPSLRVPVPGNSSRVEIKLESWTRWGLDVSLAEPPGFQAPGTITDALMPGGGNRLLLRGFGFGSFPSVGRAIIRASAQDGSMLLVETPGVADGQTATAPSSVPGVSGQAGVDALKIVAVPTVTVSFVRSSALAAFREADNFSLWLDEAEELRRRISAPMVGKFSANSSLAHQSSCVNSLAPAAWLALQSPPPSDGLAAGVLLQESDRSNAVVLNDTSIILYDTPSGVGTGLVPIVRAGLALVSFAALKERLPPLAADAVVIGDARVSVASPSRAAADCASLVLGFGANGSQAPCLRYLRPVVSGVSPRLGLSQSGSTEVLVSGSGFGLQAATSSRRVWLGCSPCVNVTVIDNTRLSCQAVPSAGRRLAVAVEVAGQLDQQSVEHAGEPTAVDDVDDHPWLKQLKPRATVAWEAPIVTKATPSYLLASRTALAAVVLHGVSLGPESGLLRRVVVGQVACETPRWVSTTEVHCSGINTTLIKDGTAVVEVANSPSSDLAQVIDVHAMPVVQFVVEGQGAHNSRPTRLTFAVAGTGLSGSDIDSVTVGPYPCTSPELALEGSRLSCTVDGGVGAGLAVRITTAGGLVSDRNSLFSFASPEIHAVKPMQLLRGWYTGFGDDSGDPVLLSLTIVGSGLVGLAGVDATPAVTVAGIPCTPLSAVIVPSGGLAGKGEVNCTVPMSQWVGSTLSVVAGATAALIVSALPRVVAAALPPLGSRPAKGQWEIMLSVSGVGWVGNTPLPRVVIGGTDCARVTLTPGQDSTVGAEITELSCTVAPGYGTDLLVELRTEGGLWATLGNKIAFDKLQVLSLQPKTILPGTLVVDATISTTWFPVDAVNVSQVLIGGTLCSVESIAEASLDVVTIGCRAADIASARSTSVDVGIAYFSGREQSESQLPFVASTDASAMFFPPQNPRLYSVEPRNGISVVGGTAMNVTLLSAGDSSGAVREVTINGWDCSVAGVATAGTVESEPSLVVSVVAPPGSGAGLQLAVTLSNGLRIASSAVGGTDVSYAPPTITSLSWDTPGTALLLGSIVRNVTLRGTNLPPPGCCSGHGNGGAVFTTSLMLMDGLFWQAPCSGHLTFVSDTLLRCDSLVLHSPQPLGTDAAGAPPISLTDPLGSVRAVLQVSGHTAQSPASQLLVRPRVLFASPSTGAQSGGQEVVINGADLGSTPSQVASVTFGERLATLLGVAADGSSVTVLSPPGFGVGVQVTVTLSNGRNGSAPAFSFTQPRLSRVEPDYALFGYAGDDLVVTLYGRDLGPDAGIGPFLGASVGGVDCAIVAWVSSNALTCILPFVQAAEFLTPDVYVEFADASFTLEGAFTTLAAPCVSSISPQTAAPGRQVLVVGGGFGRVQSDVVSVKLGSAECTSFSLSSETTLSCVVPPSDAQSSGTTGLGVTITTTTGAVSRVVPAGSAHCSSAPSGDTNPSNQALFNYEGDGRSPVLRCWSISGSRQAGVTSTVLVQWSCASESGGVGTPVQGEQLTAVDVEYVRAGVNDTLPQMQSVPAAVLTASRESSTANDADAQQMASQGLIPPGTGVNRSQLLVERFQHALSGTPEQPVTVRVRRRNAFGAGPWSSWSPIAVAVCGEGSFLRDTGQVSSWTCSACPPGAVCSAGSRADTSAPQPSFARVPFSSHGLAFQRCLAPVACTPPAVNTSSRQLVSSPGIASNIAILHPPRPRIISFGRQLLSRPKSVWPPSACAPGHLGPLCGVCTAGYAATGQGDCVKCPAAEQSRLQTGGLIALALAIMAVCVAFSCLRRQQVARQKPVQALSNARTAARPAKACQSNTPMPEFPSFAAEQAASTLVIDSTALVGYVRRTMQQQPRAVASRFTAGSASSLASFHAGNSQDFDAAMEDKGTDDLSLSIAFDDDQVPRLDRAMTGRTLVRNDTATESNATPRGNRSGGSAKRRSSLPLVLKSFISYLQTVVIVSGLSVPWPEGLRTMFLGFDATSSLSAETLSLDCVLKAAPAATSIAERPLFVKALVSLLLPACVIGALIVAAAVAHCLHVQASRAQAANAPSSGPRFAAPLSPRPNDGQSTKRDGATTAPSLAPDAKDLPLLQRSVSTDAAGGRLRGHTPSHTPPTHVSDAVHGRIINPMVAAGTTNHSPLHRTIATALDRSHGLASTANSSLSSTSSFPDAAADSRPERLRRLVSVLVVLATVLLFLVQASSTRTALRLMTCVTVGSADWELENHATECATAGMEPSLPGVPCDDFTPAAVLRAARSSGAMRRHLAADLGVDCEDDEAAPLIYGLGTLSFLLYGFGVPATGLILLLAYRKKLQDPVVMDRLGFLYHGMRPTAFLWEPLSILRKTLLGVTTVLLAPMGSSVQATASSLVLGFFIAAHARANPFQSGSLDLAELISLVVSQATMLCGLLLSTSAVSDSQASVTTIAGCVIVANAVCIALFVRALWRAAKRDGLVSNAASAARSAVNVVKSRKTIVGEMSSPTHASLDSKSADTAALRRRSQRALRLRQKTRRETSDS